MVSIQFKTSGKIQAWLLRGISEFFSTSMRNNTIPCTNIFTGNHLMFAWTATRGTCNNKIKYIGHVITWAFGALWRTILATRGISLPLIYIGLGGASKQAIFGRKKK